MLLSLVVPFQFLLPGYSWIRFSGLQRHFGIVETLVISFILSVSFTSLFTAGLSLLTSHYLSYSVIGSLVLSLVPLIASLRRQSIPRNPRPKLNHELILVVAIASAYAAVLASLLWSSPFYPTTDAFDPITHAALVHAISSGLGRTTLLHSNYPLGLHFVAAVWVGLLDVNSLVAIRFLLSVVIVVSVFLTYFCARSILGSQYAILAVIAATFVVPADAIHFIKIGTFPNILSDVLVIATLWLIACYAKNPNHSLGLTLTFLAIAGMFVHSTFLIFLVALWLGLPVFLIYGRQFARDYLRGLLFATSGLLVLVVSLATFESANLSRIFSDYVGGSFSSIPVLLYLQTLVWNYSVLAGPLAAFSIAIAVVFVLAKRRNLAWLVFLCVWFCLLMVAAVVSPQGWRFILLSMIPAGFLLAGAIGSLRELGSHSTRPKLARMMRMIVPILLCVLILSGGFVSLLPRVYDPSNRVREGAVVDSMLWLKQNDQGLGVASVGLSADYRYLTILTGIPYAGDFNYGANSTVAEARVGNFTYVAVAVQGSQFPTFGSSNLVEQKYRNSFVAIFFIAA